MKRAIPLVACMLLLGTVSSVDVSRADATEYTLRELGTLGGSQSYSFGLDNSGRVVGYSYANNGWLNEHAFLWNDDVMTELGTFGGLTSYAYAINNFGRVVGYSNNVEGYERAFIWSNGAMNPLGTLGGRFSLAFDINDSNQVVGWSETNPGVWRGFVWQDGVMTPLGTLGGINSWARSINNQGQVVGWSNTMYGLQQAFIWEAGNMTSLGDLGSGFSWAYGINDYGQAVGSSMNMFGQVLAFVWEEGVMYDIGTLGGAHSRALAINNSGKAVGWAETAGRSGHAFVWDEVNGMVNLNDVLDETGDGWVLMQGSHINDRGQIAGYGMTPWGTLEAFLLTPAMSEIIVEIDVQPSINLRSRGVVPVAVLSSDEFDAADIDPASVEFAGAQPVRWALSDVDGDGEPDLMLHFRTQDLNLTADSTEAVLTGMTIDGMSILGSDSVRIVPAR